MRKSMLSVLSGLAVYLFGASVSLATISNGDFSSGLTGWTTTGVVSTAASFTHPNPGAGTVSPTAGSQVTQLRNTGGSNLATVAASLGVTAAQIQAFSDSLTHPYSHWTVTNGSTLTRTVQNATNYISFDWNFWRRDYPAYNDFAFFTISGPGITGTDIILLSDVNNSAEALANTTGYGPANGTGWQSYSYSLPSTGDYTIGFAVMNARDTAYATYLHVDNVDSVVIPEPSTALTALLLLGTGLFYPLRRHRLSAA